MLFCLEIEAVKLVNSKEEDGLMTDKIIISKQDCLVIIDPNADFSYPGGKLFVEDALGKVPNSDVVVNIIYLDYFPFGHFVVTDEGHPAGHIEFRIHGEHCEKGTDGCNFPPTLRHLYRRGTRVRKGGESLVYSYAISTSRQFLDLISSLRKMGIKRSFVAGWVFEFCVGESAIDLARQHFEVFIIQDACRSILPEEQTEIMRQKLKLYEVRIITMDQLAKTAD